MKKIISLLSALVISVVSFAGISNLDFNEFDILKNPSLKPTMVERSNGSKTVPQIFINTQYIGGLEQLVELDQNGTLDQIIQKNDY